MFENIVESLPPILVLIVVLIVIVLVVAIAALLLWAFLQGKPIQFGPIGIGGDAGAGHQRAAGQKRLRKGALTWVDMNIAVKTLHQKMSAANYRPAVMVCMGRGGAVVGALLSQYFGNPVIPLAVLTIDHKMASVSVSNSGAGRVRDDGVIEICQIADGLDNVLLLGIDIISGTAMTRGSTELSARHVNVTASACLFWNSLASFHPNYYAEMREGRQMYPWMKQSFRESWGVN